MEVESSSQNLVLCVGLPFVGDFTRPVSGSRVADPALDVDGTFWLFAGLP